MLLLHFLLPFFGACMAYENRKLFLITNREKFLRPNILRRVESAPECKRKRIVHILNSHLCVNTLRLPLLPVSHYRAS